MYTIVDTRTMMVMHVYTGEGPIDYVPYKSDTENDDHCSMTDWDYD